MSSDKYRWHDFNEDLPKDNSEVLAAFGMKLGGQYYEHYQVLTYSTDLFKVDEWSFYNYKDKKHEGFYYIDDEWGYVEVSNVDGWRYIEPFEKHHENL